MDISKFNKWLIEDKSSKKRNFYVLIGPPAVGKTSWIKENIKESKIVISKDDIIENDIFPKYKLANKDIFKVPTKGLEVGDEHPSKKKLGKVISYKRFSRSKGKEVEEKAFKNAHAAGQELNQIYDSKIKKAIASNIENIIIDAIHMSRSTRASTIDLVRDDKQFNIIGVVFPHKGYERQIFNSAELRAKDFLERFGSEFDRGVSWDDYEEIYRNFEEPSKSEGFDQLVTANIRFKKTDKDLGINISETDNEKFVRHTKKFLDKDNLSKYWKNRANVRSKHAKRDQGNSIDLEWAKLQQEKSKKINYKIHKIFERDVNISEEIIEEVENFLKNVKKKRQELKKKMEEKKRAKLFSPTNKNIKNRKKPGNPYKDSKVTSKYPYSKDRTGGVAKVYKKRSKQAGGPTLAPGEGFGPLEENQNAYDSLTDVQKENFHILIAYTEEYDILKQRQGSKRKSILNNFNLSLEDAIEFIQKCPVLKKPIDRIVTAGTMGFIYLLDNGHILKLFQDDYAGGNDLNWYQTTKTRMFTSKGNITDLPIYDEGQINLDGGEYVKYVEMARVTPLSDFIEFTKRSPEEAENDYELCKAVVGEIEGIYGSKFIKMDVKKVADIFKHYIQKKQILPSALTMQEYVNLAKTIFLFAKSGNALHDSHVGNIGVLPQSNPSNPIFVIFDN